MIRSGAPKCSTVIRQWTKSQILIDTCELATIIKLNVYLIKFKIWEQYRFLIKGTQYLAYHTQCSWLQAYHMRDRQKRLSPPREIDVSEMFDKRFKGQLSCKDAFDNKYSFSSFWLEVHADSTKWRKKKPKLSNMFYLYEMTLILNRQQYQTTCRSGEVPQCIFYANQISFLPQGKLPRPWIKNITAKKKIWKIKSSEVNSSISKTTQLKKTRWKIDFLFTTRFLWCILHALCNMNTNEKLSRANSSCSAGF